MQEASPNDAPGSGRVTRVQHRMKLMHHIRNCLLALQGGHILCLCHRIQI
jgi:hypothetical protein